MSTESMSGTITVGVVAISQPIFAAECIRSIFRSQLSLIKEVRCVVVLNGADIETASAIQALTKEYSFTIISNTANRGYAFACNQILEKATSDYICFLHSDVLLSSRTLELLYQQAEATADDVGVFYPLTNYANEHFPCIPDIRRAYEVIKPSNKEIYTKETLSRILSETYGDFEKFALNLEVDNRETPLRVVEEATSYCGFFRRNLLEKAGGFNPAFTLRGYEDKELSLRFSRSGYRQVLNRIAFVHHHGNLSSDGQGFDYANVMMSQEQIYKQLFEQSKLVGTKIKPSPLITQIPLALRQVISGSKTKAKTLLYFSTHYPPENAGGAELSAHETHKQLAAYGIEICAVTIRNRAHKKFDTFRSFKHDNVTVMQLPEDSGEDLQSKIRFIVESIKPDAVMTHSRYAIYVLETLSRFYPNIARMFFFRHQTDILDGALGKYLEKDGGTRLYSNSLWMQKVLREQTKRDSDLILPVVLPKTCLIPEAERQRMAVVIGNGVLSKGIKEFLAIARSLPSIPFQVWGTLDPKVPQAVIPPNVATKGWTTSLGEIYQQAKVVVNLSEDPEPFGRTLVEAMFNEIPVIAHKEGGPTEIVEHGGVLVSSTEQAIEAIESIFRDPAYYRQLCLGTKKDLERYNPYYENSKLIQRILAALGSNLAPGYAL